jgi:hypothetical protein
MLLEKGKEYTMEWSQVYIIIDEFHSYYLLGRLLSKNNNYLMDRHYRVDSWQYSKLIPYNRVEKGQFLLM